jgi:hypothetical protein
MLQNQKASTVEGGLARAHPWCMIPMYPPQKQIDAPVIDNILPTRTYVEKCTCAHLTYFPLGTELSHNFPQS